MKNLNRWIYAIVGVIILLGVGLIYAWSVLVSPISEEFPNWSNASLSLTFTLCMMFFCLGGLVGGIVQKKIDIRINVIASALLFISGFYIASKAQSVTTLYIGYGFLCGSGCGLAYNAVMSTMTKWFLDKQGLISGILLMGFGLSSFIVGKLYEAYTPDKIGGWRTSFIVFGVVLAVILLIGMFFFVKPDEKFMEEKSSKAAVKNKKQEQGLDLKVNEMIKRPSFWFYFIWATLLSAAGLALISQARGIASEISPSSTSGTIATVVGLISIFNGLGRVIYGAMYDKYGRLKTMTILDIVFIFSIVILIFALISKQFTLLICGFILCGASYGGVTSTNSAFINSFYGSTNYPVNFSIINMNLLIASFGSTIAGALYDSTGNYISIFIIMAVALVIGFVCTFCIKRP